MPACVISEVDVHDAAGFENCRTIAARTIAQYGVSAAARSPSAGRSSENLQ
jgi:uncharacterized protein (DUF1330 family)